MTIDEIKSVSILQWMRLNNYGDGIRKGRNYFFCSPLRSERTPSFSVNTAKNLWCDFGSYNKNGGNIINLVEQLNPSWSEHQVLAFLERQIKDLKLTYSKDYNARLEEEEQKRQWIEGKRAEREEQLNQETVVEMVIPLSHPYLRDYVIQRRIDYSIAQRFCQEVHYSLRGKKYYAIAFMNIAMEWKLVTSSTNDVSGKRAYQSSTRWEHLRSTVASLRGSLTCSPTRPSRHGCPEQESAREFLAIISSSTVSAR